MDADWRENDEREGGGEGERARKCPLTNELLSRMRIMLLPTLTDSKN